MRNIRLTLEYDGTDFVGWQTQPGQRTVQEVVERVITRMTGETLCLHGSGRTDSGVHARGQVANFQTEARIPLEGFRRGLNAWLPGDVAVVAIAEVPAGFDARRSARGKHYVYRILNREDRAPLHARTSWHVMRALDLEAMRTAAAALLGEHDFSAFRGAHCDAKNPVRTLRRLDVLSVPPLLEIHAEGTAFLRHMVRVIAGTLVDVGLGAIPAAEIPGILAGRDRSQAGRTAPALGLTLERVAYE